MDVVSTMSITNNTMSIPMVLMMESIMLLIVAGTRKLTTLVPKYTY